jgi:DNA-binding XRE family transcriptional regulator
MARAELEDATNANHIGNTVEYVLERSNMVKARRLVRLSQVEVATRVGVKETTYVSWEKAHQTPRLYQLEDLCAILSWQGSDEELLRIFTVKRPVKKVNMDAQKRQTLKLVGSTLFLPGTAILIPVPKPDEYLAMAESAIDSCWHYLALGDLNKVERALNAHIPTLTEYANTNSSYQKKAASLAVQAVILQVQLSNCTLDYAARLQQCIDAVSFARLSGSPSLLAASQFWQGDTYTYCLNQPKDAIALFESALEGLSSEAQLSKSAIYIDLAIAHAQDQDGSQVRANAKKARDYVDLARKTMPKNPELDALYHTVSLGHSELNQHEGRVNLYLAQKSCSRKLAQKAYNLFNTSLNEQAHSLGFRCQALIRKADASISMDEMGEFETSLRSALDIIKSRKRFSEIDDVVSRIPEKWRNETLVQRLHSDINKAQAKLITPTSPA